MKFWERAEFNLAIGVLLLVLGVLLSDIPTMIASLDWPTVPGVITSQRLIGQRFKEYDGDYYIQFEGYLKYQYTVEGVGYSASAVDVLEQPAYPEETARNYPVGKEVTVHYDPRNPSRAVLEPGFVASGKAFGLAASLSLGGGLYFLGLGLWRRVTARRSYLRGWPPDEQSGQGIGTGIGRM